VSTNGYWAIALIVGLESMGIPLPGETILVLAAIYAGQHGGKVVFLGRFVRWQNRSTLLPYRSAVVRERSKEDRDEPLAVSGCELTLENCQRTLI
jgi:membrane protein DedA with SNARE-associated domain